MGIQIKKNTHPKGWVFVPDDRDRGRDDWAIPSNPDLKCPSHIVASGSSWFCTGCGTNGWCQYEHGIKDMFKFIRTHRLCNIILLHDIADHQ